MLSDTILSSKRKIPISIFFLLWQFPQSGARFYTIPALLCRIPGAEILQPLQLIHIWAYWTATCSGSTPLLL